MLLTRIFIDLACTVVVVVVVHRVKGFDGNGNGGSIDFGRG